MPKIINPLKVVIVGGVAGGATAAARARRVSELSKITMFERGHDISVASCGLPYHVAGEIRDRSRLVMATPEHLKNTLNVDVKVGHNVESIDRKNKTISVSTGSSPMTVPYDKLLIATGASALIPPIPGLQDAATTGRLLAMRSLEDMDNTIKLVKSAPGGRCVIVGAGFIGLEMAEALQHCGLKVTVIEFQNRVMPLLDYEIVAPVQEEMAIKGIRVMTSNKVVAFHDDPAHKEVTVELASGERIVADFVIQSIGVVPESSLAQAAGLEVDARKAIIVNPYMQTSDPDVYAAGDVASTPFCAPPRQKWLPLGGPANRMARIAADHMFLGDALTDPYRGSFGTSIVRVFDSVAGKTGLSEGDCIAQKLDYAVSTITGPSHASYYPGSYPITLKVVYDKSSGKLLGAQAVGGLDGVDKRLDVIATALAGGLTIDDLAHLDLAYAPPFGSARDVVNTVGFFGLNERSGMMAPIESLAPTGGAKQPLVLDVRDAMTASVHPVPGADEGGVAGEHVVNIPIEELRARVDEIKKLAGDRGVLTVCNLGKTSYFASRVLDAHGIHVSCLAGGLTMLRSKIPTVLDEPEAHPSKNPLIKSAAQPAPTPTVNRTLEHQVLDLCGLACPGPIMAIRKALPTLASGQTLTVKASDPGFFNDFKSFCRVNKLDVISVNKADGLITGQLMKPVATGVAAPAPSAVAEAGGNNLALVVFSGEMDKVMAAFVLANGAVAMGGKVTMFFTFWGLNALRCQGPDNCPMAQDGVNMKHPSKSIMDRMLTSMLPKGPDSLPLSNLQMHGLGPIAMKMQMGMKNLPNLKGLMKDAQEGGVRMVACTMSMDALGVHESELIKGVEYGGVADFLEAAGNAKSTLFI